MDPSRIESQRIITDYSTFPTKSINSFNRPIFITAARKSHNEIEERLWSCCHSLFCAGASASARRLYRARRRTSALTGVSVFFSLERSSAMKVCESESRMKDMARRPRYSLWRSLSLSPLLVFSFGLL